MARSITSADLPPDLARFAEAEIAAGHFATVEDVLRAGKEALERQQRPGHEATLAEIDEALDEGERNGIVEGDPFASVPAEPPTPPPFLATFVEQFDALPDEVFERLPKDGASQVDHYLYGAPKRGE